MIINPRSYKDTKSMNLRNQEEYEHMYNIASENVRFDM